MLRDVSTPRTRSYSQFSSFAECGEKYRLERVARVPRRQAVWFPAGTAYHSTTEWFDRELFWGEPVLSETGRQTLGQVWAENFGREVDTVREDEPDESKWKTAGRPSADKPQGETLDWWRVEGERMVQAYADWWEADPPWRVWTLPDGEPALEVPVERTIGRTPVKGFVDQVLEHDDGTLLVVDKKTGSREPQFPLQLATYAVELRETFGLAYWWGSYFMARSASLTKPKPLSPYTPELLATMYDRMDQAERLGLYLPNLGSHCNNCLVRDYCVPAGGVEYKAAA